MWHITYTLAASLLLAQQASFVGQASLREYRRPSFIFIKSGCIPYNSFFAQRSLLLRACGPRALAHPQRPQGAAAGGARQRRLATAGGARQRRAASLLLRLQAAKGFVFVFPAACISPRGSPWLMISTLESP